MTLTTHHLEDQLIKRRIAEAWRYVELGSELDDVLQRWKEFRFIVKREEQWLLEGFINFFQFLHEVTRAVDPTFPTQLAPDCFDAESIAALFHLSVTRRPPLEPLRNSLQVGERRTSVGPVSNGESGFSLFALPTSPWDHSSSSPEHPEY